MKVSSRLTIVASLVVVFLGAINQHAWARRTQASYPVICMNIPGVTCEDVDTPTMYDACAEAAADYGCTATEDFYPTCGQADADDCNTDEEIYCPNWDCG